LDFFGLRKWLVACHAKKKLPHKKSAKELTWRKTTLGKWIKHCNASCRIARKNQARPVTIDFDRNMFQVEESLSSSRDSVRDNLPYARRIPQLRQRQEGCKN
jgi:hypothetical protein